MAKKPRKKYTPLKFQHRVSSKADKAFREMFKHVGIVCNLLDNTQSHLFEERKLPKIGKTEVLHRLFEHKHEWTVYGAVCFKEANGKHKLKVVEMASPCAMQFSQIADSLYETHKNFLYEFIDQVDRMCGYGFVSYPADVEKSDEMLMKALEEAGCFDGSRKAVLVDGEIAFVGVDHDGITKNWRMNPNAENL